MMRIITRSSFFKKGTIVGKNSSLPVLQLFLANNVLSPALISKGQIYGFDYSFGRGFFRRVC